MKLDSRYGEYFPEYANYFGGPLRLNKPMYGMTNPVKLFADELTNWLINESGFNQSKYQISLYYKYAPYESRLVVLSYVYDSVNCYTPEELGKWFVDTLGKIFHVNLLGYTHWLCPLGYYNLRNILFQWIKLDMILTE